MTKPDASSFNPTLEDRARTRIRSGEMLMSGDGFFATQQGEGITSGAKAVFARLHHCNLACGLKSGWKCDADYTWDRRLASFWKEPVSVSAETAARIIVDTWEEVWGKEEINKRVVFTGGEPLLQQRVVAKVVEKLSDWIVEVETNGTIMPREGFLNLAQINCSPKLVNSGNGLDRYRPEVLSYIGQMPNSWFKFVVTHENDFEEIDQIVSGSRVPLRRIIIMPEGRDVKEIEMNAARYLPMVRQRGWGGVTLRNQFVWFGDKRAT